MGGHFGWRYAFLAGVRSPPLRGGEPRTDGLAGRCRGETKAFPCGRAEPAPPRGGQLQRRSPTGERPEMTREVVFSEGRGLRARVVRPETSRGTSILWTSRREAGGRRERAIRLALCRHRGRAEPAPPRNRNLTRRASGFKARCIGKAPCRHYARGALGKPRSGLSG
jgi:hypothetical protein